MPERFIEDPKIDQIKRPALLDFFRIWQQPDEEHGQPRPRDFTLSTFFEHVSFMNLIEYDAAADRFVGKFFGADFVECVGVDPTNQCADELPNADHLLDRIRRLVDTKHPYLSLDVDLVWSPKNFKTCDAIACPLFDDQGDVFALMVRIEFED